MALRRWSRPLPCLRPPAPARAPARARRRLARRHSDRARGGGSDRSPGGGAAPVRMCGRSRHPDRCRAARACRERQGRRHHRRRCAAGASSRLRDDGRQRTDGRRTLARLVVAADEEALPFRDASLDLVVSVLALQFVNDLPGTLIQIRRALKPDGLLLAALAGGDTLTELRQAFAAAEAEIEDGVSPRVAPFADVREHGRAAAAGGFRAAGDRRRPDHGALRLAACADARSAPHGRDQSADRAQPAAARARDADADDGDLRRAFRRCATAASGRRSRSSGSPAGRRMRASRSRWRRARRGSGLRMRSGPRETKLPRRPVVGSRSAITCN